MEVESQPAAAVEAFDCCCYPQRVRPFMRKHPNLFGWGLAVFLLASAIVVLSVVPESFAYVEYDQWAFRKDTIENSVDTGRVYGNGRYAWGTQYDPLTFPRPYQRADLKLAIFPSQGLEFEIGVTFWYRLRPDQLPQFFSKFGVSFQGQIASRANAKIKNAAPLFPIEEFITNREHIADALHHALETEMNSIYIEAPRHLFFLTDINIPATIRERDLDAAVIREKNKEEQNHQRALQITAETQRMVQEISSNITFTAASANAKRVQLIAEANAQSTRLIESADALGLHDLLVRINSSSPTVAAEFVRYYALLENLRS